MLRDVLRVLADFNQFSIDSHFSPPCWLLGFDLCEVSFVLLRKVK